MRGDFKSWEVRAPGIMFMNIITGRGGLPYRMVINIARRDGSLAWFMLRVRIACVPPLSIAKFEIK